MRITAAWLLLAAALAACRQAETYDIDEAPTENDLAAFEARANAVQAPGPGEPGGLPDDRNLVEEGSIDPKSGQGAGQVLQSYAALLEQGRFAEARRLWTEGGAGSGLDRDGFERAHSKYAEIHAEIGPRRPGGGSGRIGLCRDSRPILRTADGRAVVQFARIRYASPRQRRARLDRGAAPLAYLSHRGETAAMSVRFAEDMKGGPRWPDLKTFASIWK